MNGSGGKSRQSLGVSEDPEQTGLKIAAIHRRLTALNHTDPTRPPCVTLQGDTMRQKVRDPRSRRWDTWTDRHLQWGRGQHEETETVAAGHRGFPLPSHQVQIYRWLTPGRKGQRSARCQRDSSAEAGSSYAEPKGIMTLASQEGRFKGGWTWQLKLAVSPSPREWCKKTAGGKGSTLKNLSNYGSKVLMFIRWFLSHRSIQRSSNPHQNVKETFFFFYTDVMDRIMWPVHWPAEIKLRD